MQDNASESSPKNLDYKGGFVYAIEIIIQNNYTKNVFGVIPSLFHFVFNRNTLMKGRVFSTNKC